MVGASKTRSRAALGCSSAVHGQNVLEESHKAHVELRHFLSAEQSVLTKILGEASGIYRMYGSSIRLGTKLFPVSYGSLKEYA